MRRINRKMTRMLNINETNDQITWNRANATTRREILPVAAILLNAIVATESVPRARMGEKSAGPIRVKEKRRNQFR
jgi:hypothetical protein